MQFGKIYAPYLIKGEGDSVTGLCPLFYSSVNQALFYAYYYAISYIITFPPSFVHSVENF